MKNFVNRKNNEFSSQKNVILCNKVHDFYSKALKRRIKFDIYYPSYSFSLGLPHAILFLNDGQDMHAVRLMETLQQYNRSHSLHPLMAVAIHPEKHRMIEYGTAGIPDYANRGHKANAYTAFAIEELLPWLENRYPLLNHPDWRAFAGFSLGGLSAFDICWNQPDYFSTAGIFSGSLWWRSEAFSENDPDANRIIHQKIQESDFQSGMRFWFQTGTLDESCDRNNNGIIDSIDDTLDLITELKSLGYEEEHISYVEVEGGLHHPHTWADVLPEFLNWSFKNS